MFSVQCELNPLNCGAEKPMCNLRHLVSPEGFGSNHQSKIGSAPNAKNVATWNPSNQTSMVYKRRNAMWRKVKIEVSLSYIFRPCHVEVHLVG